MRSQQSWWGTRESRRYRKPRPKEEPIPDGLCYPRRWMDVAYLSDMVDRELEYWRNKIKEKQKWKTS